MTFLRGTVVRADVAFLVQGVHALEMGPVESKDYVVTLRIFVQFLSISMVILYRNGLKGGT